MRKAYLMLGLVAISLAACKPDASSTAGNISDASPASASADVDLISAKAMWGVEAAYNVPAQAYVNLDAEGKLSPEVKAKVKPVLIKARAALLAARAAACYVSSVRQPNCTQNPAAFSAAEEEVKGYSDAAVGILPGSN